METKLHFILLLSVMLLSLTAGAIAALPILQSPKHLPVNPWSGQPASQPNSSSQPRNLNLPAIPNPDPPRPLKLPSRILYRVPFSSQAPLGDWNEPYQNACEETALIMVKAWLDGKNSLSAQEVDQKIHQIIAYESQRFGFFKDTSAAQTGLILEEFFDYPNYQLIKNADLTSIKQALAQGSLVIAPVIGGRLGNPNYRSETNFYHMLVVIGFDDEKQIIYTNDPGTSYGESFTYDYATFEKALSDWNPAAQQPEKTTNTIIVINPN